MAKNSNFLSTRGGRAVLGVVAFVAAWLVFLRASDTGSLQQYAILIALVFFGINRLIVAALNKA